MKIRSNPTLACAAVSALAAFGCAQGPETHSEPVVDEPVAETVETTPAAPDAGSAPAVVEASTPAEASADAVDAESVEAAAETAAMLVANSAPQEESAEQAPPAEGLAANEPATDERRRPDTSALDLAYFNTREFKKRFAESFLPVTDIEPSVTLDEQEELQEIIELIQEGKRDRAMTRLKRANNEAASATFAFLIGQLHYEDERWNEALAALDEATDKFSRFQRAWNSKGLIHYQQGEHEKAYGAFAKAISTGNTDEMTYGLMAASLLNDAKYLEAETAFRTALMMNPGETSWLNGLSRAVFMQGRYSEAVVLFDSLIEGDQDNAGYWLLQGNAYLGLGETMLAAENFQIAHQLGGSTNSSQNLLGDIYFNEGLNTLAVGAYLSALDKDVDATPTRALACASKMTRLGDVESATALLDGVESHFGDDLEQKKKNEVLKLRARIAVREGDTEGNVEVLEQIVANDPLDGDAIILLAEALERAGKLEEALIQFEVAARIEGHEARAKLSHGQALARAKRYAEAVPLLRESLQIAPKPSVQEFLEGVEKAAKRSGR